MRIKKLITALLCAATVVTVLPSAVSAKSLSWVGREMEVRHKMLLENEFKIYVKTTPDYYPYYGAKFEPRSGVYIGTPYDRKYPGIDNALDTSYDWFIPTDEIKNDKVARVEKAEVPSNHTELYGLNWNFALKNSQIIDIRDYSNYIYNYIDEVASWGKDVLLIFGKEMNIDDNFNYPELFVDCFRFVADYAHTKENIAMVWAPNDTGGLDTTFEEYYPGDEYVDWIGCSLYTMPFFQGNPNNDDAANRSFIMGPYANPSMRAKMLHDFMERNNIKKPVMITEGGVGFESPKGIDYTDWAKHQLRMYYSDLPRMYPEYKCIISFNQYVPGDLYRYDMMNNPALLLLMQALTADPIYLKSYPSSSPYSYTELVDGMIFTDYVEVSAYAYRYKKQNLVVRYLLDGNWLCERREPPYDIKLGNEHIPYGKHTLTCEIYDGEKIATSKSYKIELVSGNDRSVYKDVEDNGLCTYTDMEGKPNEMRNAVGFLSEKGIVEGVGKGMFAPDNRLSRAEIATMLMRLAGIKESDVPCGLTDLSENDWYYKTVNAAVNNGLITGYEDATFRGANAVTKNEFIAIMARILSNNKYNETVPEVELSYTDKLTDWAIDYIRIAKDSGIILDREDGMFYGDGLVSRGDAAIMMERLYREIY